MTFSRDVNQSFGKGFLKVTVKSCSQLKPGATYCYCGIQVGNDHLSTRESPIHFMSTPEIEWNETLIFENYSPNAPTAYQHAIVSVYDHGKIFNKKIGTAKCILPSKYDILKKSTLDLKDKNGNIAGSLVLECILSHEKQSIENDDFSIADAIMNNTLMDNIFNDGDTNSDETGMDFMDDILKEISVVECGHLAIIVESALKLRTRANYCLVQVGNQTISTSKVSRSTHPEWNETLVFKSFRPKSIKSATVTVYDGNIMLKDKEIGTVEYELPVEFDKPQRRTLELKTVTGELNGANIIVNTIIIRKTNFSKLKALPVIGDLVEMKENAQLLVQPKQMFEKYASDALVNSLLMDDILEDMENDEEEKKSNEEIVETLEEGNEASKQRKVNNNVNGEQSNDGLELSLKHQSFKSYFFRTAKNANKYYQAFVDCEYNDLDSLMDFEQGNESDLKVLMDECGMKRMHAKNLLKKIALLRESNLFFQQWLMDLSLKLRYYGLLLDAGIANLEMLEESFVCVTDLVTFLGKDDEQCEVDGILMWDNMRKNAKFEHLQNKTPDNDYYTPENVINVNVDSKEGDEGEGLFQTIEEPTKK